MKSKRFAYAPAALFFGLVAVAPAAVAQEQSPRERLMALATVEITAELCRLDLTDDQEAAITAIRNAMVDNGTTDAGEIATIHDQLVPALTAEVAEGLCRPKGPAMLDFQKQVGALKP